MLIRYPVAQVTSKTAQTFSRYKKIRYLSHNNGIHIRGGVISLAEHTTIKKVGNHFDINF